MNLALYAHPFSSYSQKALIALYANGIAFEYRSLESATHRRELEAMWSIKRFPVLVDGERTVVEATTIIEYLHVRRRGLVHLLPDDALAAVGVRMLDRFFDNYIATPQQKIVFDAIRPHAERDRYGVADARHTLDVAYAWLERHLADGRRWAAGDAPSLADCGAAPFLFYADWTHPIPAALRRVHDYRARLLLWPPFARAVDEARPFRHYFPLGAPSRD